MLPRQSKKQQEIANEFCHKDLDLIITNGCSYEVGEP